MVSEMTENLQSVLEAARRLPPSERRFLIEQLRQETVAADENASQAPAESLRIVDELYGSMKGLDRETIKWIAEDEELWANASSGRRLAVVHFGQQCSIRRLMRSASNSSAVSPFWLH